MSSFHDTLQRGLFIDIESVPGGEIFGLGATRGGSYRRDLIRSRAGTARHG
jgi:hypothetical protein